MFSAIAMPPGEVVDRLTILKLKYENAGSNQQKLHTIYLDLIQYESAERRLYLSLPLHRRSTLTHHHHELVKVNRELWGVEDELREYEQQQFFNEEFIRLARSVYKLNDERNRLKREISAMFAMQDDLKIYRRDNNEAPQQEGQPDS